MNKEEYSILNNEIKELITIKNLTNKEDRTLLYGNSHMNYVHHLYIKNQNIYMVYYHSSYIEAVYCDKYIQSNDAYIRNFVKLYPECCDYEFCKLLLNKGLSLPFRIWDYRVKTNLYWGRILE